jgi:hypothetical protein
MLIILHQRTQQQYNNNVFIQKAILCTPTMTGIKTCNLSNLQVHNLQILNLTLSKENASM